MGSRQLKFANAGAGGPLINSTKPNKPAPTFPSRNPLAPRNITQAPKTDDDFDLDFGDDAPKQKKLFSMKQPAQKIIAGMKPNLPVAQPSKKASYN